MGCLESTPVYEPSLPLDVNACSVYQDYASAPRIALITSVYDGDTCTAVMASPEGGRVYAWKIRLEGIDTPEIRTKDQIEKEAGLKCRDILVGLIEGRVVLLAINEKQDKYGRLLARIYRHPYRNVNVDDKIHNLEDISLRMLAGGGIPYSGGTKDVKPTSRQ